MVRRNKERCRNRHEGTALLTAVLVMFMVMTLGMALTTLAFDNNKEVVSSINYRTASQIAQAGTNMAKTVLENSASWNDDLVASNNNLNTYVSNQTPLVVNTSTTGFQWARNIAYNGGYFMVTVTDNDATHPLQDIDNTVIVKATGVLPDGTLAQYEAVIKKTYGAFPDQAIVSSGNMNFSLSAGTVITGSVYGGTSTGLEGPYTYSYTTWEPDIVDPVTGEVYTWKSVTHSCVMPPPTVLGNISCGGAITGDTSRVSGVIKQNQPVIQATDMPDLDPAHYKDKADYILTHDGRVLDHKNGDALIGTPSGTTAVLGWNYHCSVSGGSSGMAAGWAYMGSATNYNGTFYVEEADFAFIPGTAVSYGNVYVRPSGSAADPWRATVLIPGSDIYLDGAGSGVMTPAQGGVCVMDKGPGTFTWLSGNIKNGAIAIDNPTSWGDTTRGGGLHMDGGPLIMSGGSMSIGRDGWGGKTSTFNYTGGLNTFLKPNSKTSIVVLKNLR